MDQTLIQLRQRMVETSTEFLKAQRAYLKAATLDSRKSETELKDAAEEYRKATELYDATLQEFHQYLLAAEPSEMIAEELKHIEQFIAALEKVKWASSMLIEHHMELIDQDIKLTSQPSPKVDETPKDS